MTEFPEAPRDFSKETLVRFYLGRPSLLFCLASLTLVGLGLLLLMATYGLSVGDLRSPGEELSVESSIARLEFRHIAGEKVPFVVAPVKVNEVLLEVEGYGPSVAQSRVGQEVTILVPRQDPESARLKGYWPKAVQLSTILRLSLYFYVPLGLGLLLSWQRSRSLLELLRHGEVVEGKTLRTLALPRPLADYRLVRWKADQRSFWSLQAESLSQPTLLSTPNRSGVLESYLPSWEMKGEKLVDLSSWSRLFTGCSKFFLSLNLAILVMFFLL